MTAPGVSARRDRKFRQAAIVYLHVGILYELAAYALWKRGLTAHVPGRPILWFVGGAVIVAGIVGGLWRWRNPWFPRVVWAIHAMRLPVLLDGAFFRGASQGFLPTDFFLLALVVVLVNLWMLARAGWDV